MAKYRLKKTLHNKGIFQYATQFIVGVAFIFAVYFIFRYLQTQTANSAIEYSEDAILKLNSESLLAGFLKEKSDYHGTDNVAELLRIYYLTNDKAAWGKIEQIAKSYFSKSSMESGTTSWSLAIYNTLDEGNQKQIEGRPAGILASKKFVSYQEVPIDGELNSGNVGIEIYYISKS